MFEVVKVDMIRFSKAEADQQVRSRGHLVSTGGNRLNELI